MASWLFSCSELRTRIWYNPLDNYRRNCFFPFRVSQTVTGHLEGVQSFKKGGDPSGRGRCLGSSCRGIIIIQTAALAMQAGERHLGASSRSCSRPSCFNLWVAGFQRKSPGQTLYDNYIWFANHVFSIYRLYLQWLQAKANKPTLAHA